ncbi:beta-lactamase family protein, partial [bacterium]|nr:beta-lactamase family protein [bacterium]
DSTEVLARDNYAVGHAFDYYGNIEKYYNPDDYGAAADNPSGMLFSTTEDMARFGMMLLCKGEDVLTPQSVAKMSDALVPMHLLPNDYYGYGLYQDLDDPLGGIGHDGSLPGFLTFFRFSFGRNLGVVVFVNSRNFSPAALCEGIVEILLDYEFPQPDYSTSPETWGKYTSIYVDPYSLGRINVYQDFQKRLWAEFIDLERLGYEDGPVQLYQYAGDTFFFDSALYQTTLTVTFWLDDNGKGEYFATRGGTAKRGLSEEMLKDEINSDLREQIWKNKLLPYSQYLICQ